MPPREKQVKKNGEEGTPQVTKAIDNGNLMLTVEDLVVTARIARGDYNRNQVYGHIAVKPVVPWTIAVPVGDLQGPDALREAISALQDALTEAVQSKATELEKCDREGVRQATAQALASTDGGRHRHVVEVEVPITSVESRRPGRPRIEAVAIGEPPEDESAF